MEPGHSLAALATYVPQQANVASGDTPARIEYALVTPDLFAVLGVKVRYGRPFDPADNEPGRGAVVVLSHASWRQVTGGDPGIVGRAITLDGRPVTVIGVLEAGVAFPSPTTALWAPLARRPMRPGPRQARWVQAIGRLRGGVALPEAQAEFDAAGKRLAAAYPETNRDIGFLLEPELRAEIGGARPALMLLWVPPRSSSSSSSRMSPISSLPGPGDSVAQLDLPREELQFRRRPRPSTTIRRCSIFCPMPSWMHGRAGAARA